MLFRMPRKHMTISIISMTTGKEDNKMVQQLSLKNMSKSITF